jgi:hypothetical protein
MPVEGDKPTSAAGVRTFFGSTTGRIVIIVVALAMLAVILGIVGTIVVGWLLGSSGEQGPVVTAQPSTTSTATPAPAVPTVSDRDVFTPRNPFQPIFLPAVPTSTSTTETASSDPNTLSLLRIVDENGVRHGVFSIGSTEYTVSAGETLGETPWKAVSIGVSSAVMMYGDTQIVLTVGQGVMTK